MGGEKGKEEGEEETWKWSALWVMWCMGYGMFCMILFERLMTKSGMHGYHYTLLSYHLLARCPFSSGPFFHSCRARYGPHTCIFPLAFLFITVFRGVLPAKRFCGTAPSVLRSEVWLERSLFDVFEAGLTDAWDVLATLLGERYRSSYWLFGFWEVRIGFLFRRIMPSAIRVLSPWPQGVPLKTHLNSGRDGYWLDV